MLVEPAEKPDQQNDRNGDPDQPEQKTSTHFVLLVRLAHINVRWELRFHGKAAGRERTKTGPCYARGHVRVRVPVQASRDRIRGGRSFHLLYNTNRMWAPLAKVRFL